jgi:Mlc titration factor MtfA (ptsG expression regulator)
MKILILFVTATIIFIFIFTKRLSRKSVGKASTLPLKCKDLLAQEVPYYQHLKDADKERFETSINNFINRVTIEWVGLEANDKDRVLVAASAVIPIFGFGEWQYPNLTNVILYPDAFNHEFAFEGGNRNILGMVGGGYMNGQMILSQKSLREGFSIPNSHQNTAIHEFVHLLDKSDGATDGIPSLLLDKLYILPWTNLVYQEIKKIDKGNSDINPYGASNESEFLAVVSEYFFSQPKQLKQKHPELYGLLEKVFQQSPQQ